MTDSTRTRLAQKAYKRHSEQMWPQGVAPVWKSDGAFEERVWLNVVDTILDELMEPGEGARHAFTAACFDGDVDMLEPKTGSGQGDLQMVPVYENVWDDLLMTKRWQAILTAIREGQ